MWLNDQIIFVLESHLINDANYEFLTHERATEELRVRHSKFLLLHSTMEHTLPSKAEQVYFKHSMENFCLNQTRVLQIYSIYKVHKKDIKPRPAISSVNSIPEIFSKHVDY